MYPEPQKEVPEEVAACHTQGRHALGFLCAGRRGSWQGCRYWAKWPIGQTQYSTTYVLKARTGRDSGESAPSYVCNMFLPSLVFTFSEVFGSEILGFL